MLEVETFMCTHCKTPMKEEDDVFSNNIWICCPNSQDEIIDYKDKHSLFLYDVKTKTLC